MNEAHTWETELRKEERLGASDFAHESARSIPGTFQWKAPLDSFLF